MMETDINELILAEILADSGSKNSNLLALTVALESNNSIS